MQISQFPIKSLLVIIIVSSSPPTIGSTRKAASISLGITLSLKGCPTSHLR